MLVLLVYEEVYVLHGECVDRLKAEFSEIIINNITAILVEETRALLCAFR